MYAGFLLRLKAFAVDYLLILAYLAVLLIFSVFLMPSLQGWFQQSQVTAQLAGFLLLTLPVSLYFIITDSRVGKQSIGKRKMQIRVVDENNRSISICQSIFRIALKFLPWELSHFMAYRMIYMEDGEVLLVDYFIGGLIYGLILLYVLMVFLTKNNQSFYDYFAKTYVVKLNYS
ncbi:RDD family protein [Planococcus soli]|uniref:RDD family protein n=1 Tax=Planococcus soli TaxID=2666072 RepID=UPI00115CAA16|nr:RDD family protein [Planococcus soli]